MTSLPSLEKASRLYSARNTIGQREMLDTLYRCRLCTHAIAPETVAKTGWLLGRAGGKRAINGHPAICIDPGTGSDASVFPQERR